MYSDILIIKFNIEPFVWRVCRQWIGWKYVKLYNYRRYGFHQLLALGLGQWKGIQRLKNQARSPAEQWSGWSGCLDGESLKLGSRLLLATPSPIKVVLNPSHPSITRKQVKTYEVWKEESWSCLFHTLDQNLVES